MNTLIERKGLVSTKGLANVDNTLTQSVRIPTDGRWTFLGDFTISFCYKHIGTLVANQLIFISDDTKASYLFFLSPVATPNSPIGQVKTVTGNIFNVNSIPISGNATNDITRVTFSRISNVIYCYFNARMVLSQSSFTGAVDLALGQYIGLGGGYNTTSKMNGLVGQLLALNGKGMTLQEVSEWHRTNIPPLITRPFVVAHYKMNSSSTDGIIYDSVEEYNYSRYPDINFLQGAFTNSNFTTQATNGNTASLTNGSDSDGAYVEFEFTAAPVPTPYLLFNPVGSSVKPGVYKISITLKFITGVSSNGIGFDLDDTTQNVKLLSESTYGTSKVVIEFYQSTIYTISSAFQSYLWFYTGSGMFPVGSKVRIYAFEITAILQANHGDFIGYSNTDIGLPNNLLKTGLADFYRKSKEGNSYLKLSGTSSSRAQLASYTETGLAAWFLFLDIYTVAEESGGSKLIFSNLDAANEVSVFVTITGAINIYLNRDGGTVLSQVFGVRVGKRTKILLNCSGGTNVWFQGDDYNDITFVANMAKAPDDFTNFAWLGTSSGLNIVNSGIARCIFGTKFLSTHEIQAVFAYSTNDRYRSIPQLKFDIDFGDVYLNAGNYFVRDKTANNRNPQLYGFTPETDLPVLFNPDYSLPHRKALRFTEASSQKISIYNFNPTGEKGYTIIACVKKAVDFADTYTGIVSKRNGSLYQILTYTGPRGMAYFKGSSTNSIGPSTDLKKLDVLNGISVIQKNVSVVNGFSLCISGFKVWSVDDFVIGFDTIGAVPLEIGNDNTHYLDGYISHVSIWKGVLSQAEMLDVINLNKVPSRFWLDCQLYLNFDEIKFLPAKLDVTNITSGFHVYQPCTVGYGSDSDGNYCEITGIGDPNGTAAYDAVSTHGYVPLVGYNVTVKFKFMDASSISNFSLYYFGSTPIDTTTYPEGTAQTVTFLMTPPVYSNFCMFTVRAAGSGMNGKRIRIYSFKIQRVNGYVRDYSPQNRSALGDPGAPSAYDNNIVLMNYSANETNPAHADYKLFPVEKIVLSYETTVWALPTDVLAKTWAWYDVERSDLAITTFDQPSKWVNKLLDTSRDFVSGASNHSGLQYRRFKAQKFFLLEAGIIGNRYPEMYTQSKNLDFMHNGSSWFMSFLYGTPTGSYSGHLHHVLDSRGGSRGVRVVFSPDDNLLQILIVNDSANAITLNNTHADNKGKLNHYVINFDASAGSNHMSVYRNGALVQNATSSGTYSSSASGQIPMFFNFEANTDPLSQLYGEIVIGNQALTSGELTNLFNYHTTKYGSFPKTI